MSVLENFKNIPRSPYGGATGLKCNIFVSSNLQRSPWRKKKRGACRPPNGRQAPVAHPRGDRPLSPVGGATGSPVQIGTIASGFFSLEQLLPVFFHM